MFTIFVEGNHLLEFFMCIFQLDKAVFTKRICYNVGFLPWCNNARLKIKVIRELVLYLQTRSSLLFHHCLWCQPAPLIGFKPKTR